ncbi:MAG: riboflavin kinase [Flavonifractor plautii]
MDKANGDAPPSLPLYGTAVPGAGLGRLAGLPAAGLRLHRGQAAPEPGVYAAGDPSGRSPPLRAGAYRARRRRALH